MKIAFIGFGEAGQAFAEGIAGAGKTISAYDIATEDQRLRAAKHADYDRLGIVGAATPAAAVAGADLILSLVTADQAVDAAASVAHLLEAGAIFCDMNSVAPASKRRAADLIGAGRGSYVDVAVMAPVLPARNRTPLLLCGLAHVRGSEALAAAGFSPRCVPGDVGAASAIKMLRSIMVKGLEALTAECLIAAVAAGVEDEVVASLDASYPGFDWRHRADYNLERMIAHGRRRAAEMDESAATVRELGVASTMADATAAWQRKIGEMKLDPPAGSVAKSHAILAALRTDTP